MRPLAANFEQRTGYLSKKFAPARGLFAVLIFTLTKTIGKVLDF